MTTPHNNPVPDGEPETGPIGGTWGAPVPVAEKRSTPWSAKKIIISAAVAVVIVAGGTAAVMAATNSSSSSNNFGPGGGGGFGQGGFGGGMGGAGAGLADALHGDFVVSNGSSGYTTERLQTGTVTAVSASSITVKSTDGYTQSYGVGSSTKVDQGSDTISKVATGNTVTVVATLSGQTATAATIEDSTIAQTGRVNSGQGGGTGSGSGNGSGGAPDGAPGGGFGGPGGN